MAWACLFLGLIGLIFGHSSTKNIIKDKEQGILDGTIYIDGIGVIYFAFLCIYYSTTNLIKAHYGDTWWLHVISLIYMVGFAYFIIKTPKIYSTNSWTDKIVYIALIVPFIFIIRDILALL